MEEICRDLLLYDEANFFAIYAILTLLVLLRACVEYDVVSVYVPLQSLFYMTQATARRLWQTTKRRLDAVASPAPAQ